jgi:phosphoglycolate phosphatase-like HAD superfamily hydrolase
MTHCVLSPFLVMEKILLLWDIDGTLVATAGAGRRAIDAAFLSVLGVADATAGIRFDGCTDPWICHEVFKVRGVPRSKFAGLTREVLARYVENLDQALAAPPEGKRFGPLPGIEAALAALARRDDCVLALLTGNIEPGARKKLERFDLWRYFHFGAWGDDADERPALLPVALRKAAHLGSFEPRHAVVVGDTPRDVAVGQAHGARTIAVATGGGYSRAELEVCRPTHLFDDLSCTEALLEAIFSPGGSSCAERS